MARLLRYYLGEVYFNCPDSVLRQEHPSIFVANHQSYLDAHLALLVSKVVKKRFHVQGSTQVLNDYRYLRHIGLVPAHRENPYAAIQTVAALADEFQRIPASCLWVFPQGRYERIPSYGVPRLGNSESLPVIHPGYLRIARAIPGALIFPVALRYDFLRYRRPIAFMQIGEPLVSPPIGRVRRIDRESSANELVSAWSALHQKIENGIIQHPELYESMLKSRGVLIAGQHLELDDIERQLRGVVNTSGRARRGSDRERLVIDVTSPRSSEWLTSYLLEEYQLEDEELREAFRRQCKIKTRPQ